MTERKETEILGFKEISNTGHFWKFSEDGDYLMIHFVDLHKPSYSLKFYLKEVDVSFLKKELELYLCKRNDNLGEHNG